MFHLRSNTIEFESINIIGAVDRFFGSISPFNDVVYHTNVSLDSIILDK